VTDVVNHATLPGRTFRTYTSKSLLSPTITRDCRV